MLSCFFFHIALRQSISVCISAEVSMEGGGERNPKSRSRFSVMLEDTLKGMAVAESVTFQLQDIVPQP